MDKLHQDWCSVHKVRVSTGLTPQLRVGVVAGDDRGPEVPGDRRPALHGPEQRLQQQDVFLAEYLPMLISGVNTSQDISSEQSSRYRHLVLHSTTHSPFSDDTSKGLDCHNSASH